jgi:cytochrome c peroxidase
LPWSKDILKIGIFLLILLLSCTKDEVLPDQNFGFETPKGFPEMEVPADNDLTEERWLLGKKLFYEPMLSRDSSISCGSCHLASNAFSDILANSLGVNGAENARNSPSLANIGYHPYFMREGGVPTLEQQVLVPIQEHTEMDFNIVAAAERLKDIGEYNAMSMQAYGREMDFYVITRSIACFERTLVSGNSEYDQYEYQGNSSALTAMQKKGMDLFFSQRTQCSSCHGGFNFTDYGFENNGLYENYIDQGRFILSADIADSEKFKIPSLRNVELTAPYMHDGSFQTLEEVIDHYNSGGANNPNKSDLLQSLNLTQTEKQELLAFLKSLTDYEFVNNPEFQN